MTRAVVLTMATLGAADSGAFVVQRRALFRTHPGRAMGGVTSLGLWLALAASAAGSAASPRTRRLAAGAVALNGVVLAVHLRNHIATPRVIAGSALAGAALAGTLLARPAGA